MTLIASGSNVAWCLRICKGCRGVNRGCKTKTRRCAGLSGLTMRAGRWSRTRGGLRHRPLSRGTPGHGIDARRFNIHSREADLRLESHQSGGPAHAAGALHCDSRATWRDASRQGSVRLAPWALFMATRAPVLAFPTRRISARVVPEVITPNANVKPGAGSRDISAAKDTCSATN
jgi:hypothetical protein